MGFDSDGLFFRCQKSAFNLENMHMSRKFFCLPCNWICFLSYVYLKDIYKSLEGIGKIQFVSELIILLKSANF